MKQPFGTSIVVSAFTVQATAIGLSISVYPVFMASIESEFDVSRTAASFGISALLVMGALLAPWMGGAIDRGSPRQIMVVGALLMMAGLGGLAWAPSFAVAAVLWVGLVGAGQAMLGPLPAMTVLANWFVSRRGTMIAIAGMGTTVGGAVMPPVCEALIDALGWRAAIGCLGIAAAAVGVPVVLLGIRKRPEDVGAYPDGASAPPVEQPAAAGEDEIRWFLRDPRFWLLGGAFACMNAAGIAFATHMVPLAMEQGIAREQAVFLLTVNAVGAALGKVAFGALTDRIGVRSASRVAVLVQGAGWIGLIIAGSTAAYVASAAIFAFGLGCIVPCMAAFVAEIYGRARFGRASGVMSVLMTIGAFAGPPLVGLAYDTLGSYSVPLRAIAVVVLVPFALFSLVRPSKAAAT